MSDKQTITINGKIYDAHTGLAIEQPKTQPASLGSDHHAGAQSRHIHATPQRSNTLNRRVAAKPTTASKPTGHTKVQSHVKRSAAISKFAPHPIVSPAKTRRVVSDIAPAAHPSVTKAHQIQQQQRQQKVAEQQAPAAPKPSEIIKNEAIERAMKAPSKRQKATKERGRGRMLSIAGASLALIMLGGYFTYLNMPSLSVRVAAAQAGINATYPDYKPDGYSLNGAVAYKEGEVSMKFAANGGPQNYTITQKKSNFDSSALLNNYVQPKAGDNYVTYNERGLTIYTYGSNASWVNGGIMYSINGDAPLSGDQIRRIATSL